MKILLRCVLESPIDNKLALVLLLAWHQTGNKPSIEPMMIQLIDAYMHFQAPKY